MDEKIEISKDKLEAVLDQNKELMEMNRKFQELLNNKEEQKGVMRAEEIPESTVRIMFVDGKPVKGFANRGTKERPLYVYEKRDADNPQERVLFVDILLEGKDEPIPVNYNELFREGLREECPVIDTKNKEWKIVQGEASKKVIKDYTMTETGVVIPMEVRGTSRIFTVKLPNGKEMDIHENYVNM